EGLRAERAQLGLGLAHALLAAGADRHVGALACEGEGGRAADAAAPAGHDHVAAAQSELHLASPPEHPRCSSYRLAPVTPTRGSPPRAQLGPPARAASVPSGSASSAGAPSRRSRRSARRRSTRPATRARRRTRAAERARRAGART